MALLAAGALGAAVVNIRFWTGGPAGPVAGDEDQESSSGSELAALPHIGWDEVASYLRSLPESGARRSPFFTSDETLRFASAPAAAGLLRPEEAVRLDGTLTGASRSVAWLDGHPQSEGDPVADYRVTGIETGAVTLVRGEETLRLEMSRGGAPAAAENEEQIDAQ